VVAQETRIVHDLHDAGHTFQCRICKPEETMQNNLRFWGVGCIGVSIPSSKARHGRYMLTQQLPLAEVRQFVQQQ
jgi:hypothetical protein